MSLLESLGVADPAHWAFSLLAVRATIVLLLAVAAFTALRRAPASVRHSALAFAAVALLALPLLSLLLPRWEMGVLPAPSPATGATVFAISPGRTPMASAPQPSVAEPPPVGTESVSVAESILEPATADERRVSQRAWPFSTWLLLTWGAGVAAGLAQLLIATVLVRRSARTASVIGSPDWRRYLADATTQLGLTRPVRLLSSPAAVVPLVFGYRQGVVLLPADADDWPEDRRRAFLLHELAHVRRFDCLTQTLGHVARVFYWPNPLAWWLLRSMRAEAERACDDYVLASGASASDYAAHLLAAARDLKRAERPLAVLAVVERSRLEDRLMALLDPGLRRGALTRRSLAFGALLSLTFVCLVAALQPVARAVAGTVLDPSQRQSRPLESPAAQPRREAPAAQPPSGASAGSPAEPRTDAPARSAVPMAAGSALTGAPSEAPAPAAWSSREGVSTGTAAEPVESLVARDPGSAIEKGPAPPAETPAVTAPTSNVPVIRISTELVQIDAVVTDKAGRHVVDLQPSDFEVFESGRRQRVTHLSYVKTGQGPTTGGPAALAAAPQTAAPRTLLLVVDDLSLSLESMDRTRRLLSTFAQNGLEPKDRVAILKTSEPGVRGVIMNSDAHALRTTAEGLRLNLWSRSFYPAESGRVDDRMRQSLLAIDSISALKGMIGALRAVSGRKAVIFFSEGFATAASQDHDRLLRLYTQGPLDALYGDPGIRAALNSLTDLANRASVVIYTLDPTGLTTGGGSVDEESMIARDIPDASSGSSDDSRGGPGRGDPPAVTAARRRSLFRTGQQDSLIQLADETGGLAVYNRNDMGEGLGRILADHAGYYLIGYEPEVETFSTSRGSVPFHKVKVDVKRGGLKVRSRKGFYGVPDETIAKAAPPPAN